MKKVCLRVLLIAAMVMALTLAGCGEQSTGGKAEKTEGTEAEAGKDEAAEKAAAEKEAAEKAAAEKEAAEKAAAEKKAAEAQAYYEAGRKSLYGLDGAEVDFAAAYDDFTKAVELECTEANFYLGALADRYSYPKQDYEAARNYYEASGEDPRALVTLGMLYLDGHGVEEDRAKAKDLFQAAIDKGCVEGYYGLGEFEFYAENYTAAFEYFEKALEGSEQMLIASAMNEIGYMYYAGQGVPQDYAKMLEWFEKAAGLGGSDAIENIGAVYSSGIGVPQDAAKALEWYEKAAALGETHTMNLIGDMYRFGKGVAQDTAKALEWYEKSAALGNSNAMNEIGYMYGQGEGVPQDYAKALEWYEKAVELGNDSAMNNLGGLYYSGQGVPQDYAKALEWYEKAAELGNEIAKENAEDVRKLMK